MSTGVIGALIVVGIIALIMIITKKKKNTEPMTGTFDHPHATEEGIIEPRKEDGYDPQEDNEGTIPTLNEVVEPVVVPTTLDPAIAEVGNPITFITEKDLMKLTKAKLVEKAEVMGADFSKSSTKATIAKAILSIK